MLRFNVNTAPSANTFISLDDYISKMKDGQKNIYFAFGQSVEAALKSAFYEPFKHTDAPVLVLTAQLDEFILSSASEHKGFKFMNIEQTKIDELRKDLGLSSDLG